jgi:cytochrome P450
LTASSLIPLAPGALPVLGHTIPLLRDPQGFLAGLPSDADVVQLRIGPAHALLVCTPELVDYVLHNDRIFDKGGPLFDRGREIIGGGLGTCPHNGHRRQRRLLQPAFRRTRIPDYAEQMATAVTDVIDSWQDGNVVDVVDEMSKITAKSVAGALFTGSLSSQALDHVIADLRTVLNGIYRRMLMPARLRNLPTPGNRRYVAARTRLHQEFSTIIAGRRAGDSDHNDLLSAMVEAREHHDALSSEELNDNIMTFCVVGIITTASALAWALHHLAHHPAIEEQLHSEVDNVLAGRPASHADIPRLHLTGRILTETLRITPPSWLLSRITTSDTELGGYSVPAGTNVMYSPYLIHHQDNLYSDPERFDPDRWLPGRDALPPGALIPFGSGPRKCIGDAFAMEEATLALATISSRWHVESLPGARVRAAVAAELRPRGLRMRTLARTASHPKEAVSMQ